MIWYGLHVGLCPCVVLLTGASCTAHMPDLAATVYGVRAPTRPRRVAHCAQGGAGATLGAARIIAALQPAGGPEVHFIVAACENMVAGHGLRPGDVLTSAAGGHAGRSSAFGSGSGVEALRVLWGWGPCLCVPAQQRCSLHALGCMRHVACSCGGADAAVPPVCRENGRGQQHGRCCC